MRDRGLGMDRNITRRDFVNGVSVAVGGAMALPARLRAAGVSQAHAPEKATDYYPPARTGMRGSHPGSFEAAHAARDGVTWDDAEDTGETYDLIVVGAGLSGLAAAYFFRKATSPDARVLILENHDDFGGHARRNEFEHDGQVLLVTGGTSYMVTPERYPLAAREMLQDIGVELDHPTNNVHRGMFRELGLEPAVFFGKESFGKDVLVNGSVRRPTEEFLAKTPLTEPIRRDLLRLWNDRRDYLPGLSRAEKIQRLQRISYRDYLLDVVQVHPDVLPLVGGVWCLGADTSSAWFALYRGLPGFQGLGFEVPPESPAHPDHDTTDVYFPAGNSDIARMIVRSLIPAALPAGSMASVELRRTNYSKLDEPHQPVRLRLNSAAVRAQHVGDPPQVLSSDSRETEITYVRGGKAYRVRGKGCVLACYHTMIPHLCPELPSEQKEALSLAARAVNMSTNVLVRDWRALEELGVSSVSCPGSFYSAIRPRAPITLGTYDPPRTPADPIVVSLGAGGGVLSWEPMVRGLRRGEPIPPGTPVRDQMRAVRQALLETSFEDFERRIRDQMARVLSPAGFDPARDIEAITVNRWPHGYALATNTLFDPESPPGEEPWKVASQPFGRITIANTDASGIDLTQTAFDEAHRAVGELVQMRHGWFPRI